MKLFARSSLVHAVSFLASMAVAYACVASPDSQLESVAGIWAMLDAMNFDKLGHAGMAFVLAFSYWRSLTVLRPTMPQTPLLSSNLFVAALAALAYCCLFEGVQQWLPVRSGSLADVAANTTGVLLFVGLGRFGVLTPIRV
jgi:hypothetical protein